MKELVAAIKARKGLGNLDDAFVRERIERMFQGNRKLEDKYRTSRDFQQFSKSREWTFMLKTIRKELRAIYGVFQETREGIDVSEENLHAILKTHVSTRERLPYYERIYKELADRIPAPATVLDLGCGLNPLSQPMMRWRPKMIGIDISATDMAFLEDAMQKLTIPGKTITLDLTKQYAKLDGIGADVTFVLKLLDTLEETSRHVSYKLFDHIRSPWIVASFPTASLGGRKRIAAKGRSWFERLLRRKGMRWETFTVENELFYVIQTDKNTCVER